MPKQREDSAMAETIKLSDYVMRFLVDQGVTHIFMLVGGGAMNLNNSVANYPKKLHYVCNLHEQACAIAAEAYAKYDNRLGVVLVTAGPGATNTITGLAGAWLDSTPVLFLSGQVKRADMKTAASGLRNKGPQEIDIIPLVRPLTKYAITVLEPSAIRYHLEKAVHMARSGRPGPVWIEIPLDVQAAQVAPELLKGFTPLTISDPVSVLPALVTKTIELFNEAERPFVLLGNGIRLASALPEIRETLEILKVPFGLTWPAIDFFPDNHPLLVGRPGSMAPRGANFAMQNADLLLTVGARLDLIFTAFAPERLARGAKKVMVDIDLAEITKLKPYLDVDVCADAGDFLRELLRQKQKLQLRNIEPWIARCAQWKRKYPLFSPHDTSAKGLISLYDFTETLCDLLPEGALVAPCSSGSAVEIFLLAYRAKARQRLQLTCGLGSMGFGLPASIGACLAHGSRLTVSFEGDGGFQMNSQELETLARLKLPIKLFVINNDGYDAIVATQSAFFYRLVGCNPLSGLTFPDTLRLAKAYGLPTVRLDSPRNLASDLRTVLETPGPCICEIIAIPDEPRQPRVATFQRADGSMASRPLEDMYPFLPRDEFKTNMIVPSLSE